MKRIAFISLIAAVIMLTGCVGIQYTSTTIKEGVTNTVNIKTSRVFWSTENYNCVINTNGGGTLTANKSNVDSAAITASGELLLKAISMGKP